MYSNLPGYAVGQVLLHDDFSDIHSEIVKTFSEYGSKKSDIMDGPVSYCFANQPMLNINTPQMGTCQITNKFFKKRLCLIGIIAKAFN
ncbi:MAG: hypothetical protein C0403_13610 [Desulfobacterium sp.]|nr:hypothetical protein [Desulfobacterium sp.]